MAARHASGRWSTTLYGSALVVCILFVPLLEHRMDRGVAVSAERAAGKPGTLLDRLRALSPAARSSLPPIYRFEESTTNMSIPPRLRPKMARWTRLPGQDDEEAWRGAQSQTVVVVTDAVQGFACSFNPLRAGKPVAFKSHDGAEALKEIATSEGPQCDFCQPLAFTAEELWGRISGQHTVTAANAFRANGAHGLLIFKRHNPLSVTRAELVDGLAVAGEWFAKAAVESAARQRDPARWPLLWWNAMHKSSASQIHAHAQMWLSPGPIGRTAQLRSAHAAYAQQNGRQFWHDVIVAHSTMGLAREVGGGHVLAALTPRVPAGEFIVLGPPGKGLDAVAEGLHVALRALIDARGVSSFSVTALLPPLPGEDGRPWPEPEERVVVFVLDRGSIESRTGDVGGNDLVLGATTSNVDPFQLISALDTILRPGA